MLREYEVERQVGTAGPSNCFKIYAAKKLSTKQVCELSQSLHCIQIVVFSRFLFGWVDSWLQSRVAYLCAAFKLFEKKQIERWPRAEREAFPELLRRGISQLTRLRHPRLLTVGVALLDGCRLAQRRRRRVSG